MPPRERITHALVKGIDEHIVADTEELRVELAASGVRHVKVTTVYPSYVATGMFAGARGPLLTPIGDPEAVARLLEPITAIGKKRSQGEGRISSWRVDVVDTLDPFTAGHLSPTGALARPCPAACLTGHPDIVDAGPGYAAVRPPHMHHSRRTDVRLPAPP